MVLQVQSVESRRTEEERRKLQKLHVDVVSAGTPVDGDNRMLNVMLDGGIRDKFVVPKKGGQHSGHA
jgi:hypothetical protein